jgi:hypothetical protein
LHDLNYWNSGVAQWKDDFERGDCVPTFKIIPKITNALLELLPDQAFPNPKSKIQNGINHSVDFARNQRIQVSGYLACQ